MHTFITRDGCSMRHENGNCLPCGGFCTAVNDEICNALHQAFEKGYHKCWQDAFLLIEPGSAQEG